MNYIEFFQILEGYGLSDALIPFLLIFTIVYAILQKTMIFGQGKKNFNLVIALIMGLAVVIPHVTGRYPPGGDIVNIMNSALPKVSIVLVAVIMLLIMVGVFGHRITIAGTSMASWLVVISILTIMYIFGVSAGWFGSWPNWLGWLKDPETQALVIILLIFGIIVAFITSDGDGKGSDGIKTAIGKIGDIVSK